MKLAGIILIVLGILALAYQTFTYTQKEQVAKVGPVEINDNVNHTVWIPPVVGGALIVVGVGAIVVSGRSKL